MGKSEVHKLSECRIPHQRPPSSCMSFIVLSNTDTKYARAREACTSLTAASSTRALSYLIFLLKLDILVKRMVCTDGSFLIFQY
jgi:hypothetical protein